MSAVDEYIARFSPEVRQRLLFIRQTVLNAFGEVEEKIYYGYPTVCVKGDTVLFYGAYKDHVSICVGYEWIDFLKGQFPQFGYTKATIKFPHEDPFPEDVIQTICALLKQGFSA